MAGPDRHAPADLEALRLLGAEPERFGLFAALRLLEETSPNRPRFGEARKPADDLVRLEQPPHLTFAPSDVISCEPAASGRLKVRQYGFGVFGPNGALPLHLTEYAYQRQRHHDDGAVSDFVNLFQHRFISLFYRAWAEADPVACKARPDGDRFALYVGALFGLWGGASLERDSVDDAAKLSRAALFAAGPHSADGLEAILTDYFGLPIRIVQFVGEWLEIPPELRTRLGKQQSSAVLGSSATLGLASWQSQNRFEIRVGPLAYEAFLQLLPGSRALTELRDLVRLYTSGQFSCEIRLVLRDDEAPGMELGRSGRLGWTSWLGRRTGMADDVVLQGDKYH